MNKMGNICNNYGKESIKNDKYHKRKLDKGYR